MAGSVAQTYHELGNVKKAVFTCVADASLATYPDTELTTKLEGKLFALETNPGTVAPQSNYDITIEDEHGHDVLEGVAANRHATNTEKAAIVFSGTSIHPVVTESDTLTLKIGGNNVNSAETVITLYYGYA